MRANKKLAITTICKKYGKIVCGPSITLATVQFSFFLFLFLILQFRQFNCHNFFFWQYHYRNSFFSLPHPSHHFSLLSLAFSQTFDNSVAEIRFFSPQISLNSTHITNKLHFFTIFSQKTHDHQCDNFDSNGLLGYKNRILLKKSYKNKIIKVEDYFFAKRN